jgi:hypothetical protein
MNTRALVLAAITATSLLVLTPAALASPRHNDDHRHHALTSRSDFDRYRGDLNNDGTEDDDDSDSDDSSSDGSDDSTSPDSDTAGTDTGTAAVGPVTGTGAATGTGGSGKFLSGPTQTITIQRTGFGAADNNPAGSKTISQPVIHSQAGGTGTAIDPITFASPGSAGSTEFPKGQRVYFPDLRRYGVSEDSGATKMSIKHIDLWSGEGPKSVTDPCESSITGQVSVIVNPPTTEPVTPGPLSNATQCLVHPSMGGDGDSSSVKSKRSKSSDQ